MGSDVRGFRSDPAAGEATLADLGAALPAEALVSDPAVAEAYRDDQAALVRGGRPLAVVRPLDADQIAAVIRIARARRVPVVTRGAGSGLAGAAAALEGGIVLSTERMNGILEIDPLSMVGRVQPGVVNGDFAAAAAERGLWYAPDPASRAFSTIGGNIATNAGGLCCVKYGVTRESVLGLTAVTGTGERITVGGATLKRVAGLDLLSLLVGSEGTLAVVCEATLRLRPTPARPLTGAAFFPSLVAAGDAVVGMGEERTNPALLEVIDNRTLRAVEGWRRMDLDLSAAGLVLFQSDLPGDARHDELARCVRACERAGASLVVRAEDEVESDMLMEVRRLCFPALEHAGSTLLEDVGVPRARVPELLERIQRVAQETGADIATFGHAGDGNMHPTILFDRDDARAVRRAEEAAGGIFDAALDLGGTITGEHGVGVLKLPWLEREVGPTARRISAEIKRAFDPDNILNPGRGI